MRSSGALPRLYHGVPETAQDCQLLGGLGTASYNRVQTNGGVLSQQVEPQKNDLVRYRAVDRPQNHLSIDLLPCWLLTKPPSSYIRSFS